MIVEFPNIRHLRAFREVALHRGISAAADRIHLSQPAVTQAIGKLEKRLQARLFQRRPTGMFTTPAGDILLPRVERMLAHLSAGAEQARKLASNGEEKGFRDFQLLMTATHLRALVAISETGNFSIAARTLGLSQPSVHRAARDLERLAGMCFFKASSQGVVATTAARRLARKVKLAASEIRQGVYEIDVSRGRDSTKIYVGSMPLARTSILPKAIDACLQSTEGVQILTIDGPFPELLNGLRHADLDFLIGALREPAPSDDVIQEKLFDDTLSIIVGKDHPLVGRKKLSLDDTLAFPWIAPPKTTPTGSYLSNVLRIPHLPHTPVRAVSSSLALIRGLLLSGNYITIMSRNQINHEIGEGIVAPLDINLPGNRRPIGLTYRSDWVPTETQRHFLELVRRSCLEISAGQDHTI